jgi:hypothetical protein
MKGGSRSFAVNTVECGFVPLAPIRQVLWGQLVSMTSWPLPAFSATPCTGDWCPAA